MFSGSFPDEQVVAGAAKSSPEQCQTTLSDSGADPGDYERFPTTQSVFRRPGAFPGSFPDEQVIAGAAKSSRRSISEVGNF